MKFNKVVKELEKRKDKVSQAAAKYLKNFAENELKNLQAQQQYLTQLETMYKNGLLLNNSCLTCTNLLYNRYNYG